MTRATWTAATALVLLLAGCTGSEPPGNGIVASASSAAGGASAVVAVPFADCGPDCQGEIDGAQYRILLPDEWNGTLLIYSHGYRSPVPVPPDNRPPTSAAEPSPGYGSGGVPLARTLLDQGYALAGSGWASNGWAVADGVRANRDLYRFFRDRVGEPERVYLWGDSLGGLVTMETAEAHPRWVDGAAPLCGVVGGVVPNMDLALDLQYGIRELIDPDLRLVGYRSADGAAAQYSDAARAISRAAATADGQADVLALGLLADAALQTQRQDGSTNDSKVQAAAEGSLIGLGFGTVARWEIEQRFGGNISDNTATDYGQRFSTADRALLDEVGGPGTARRIIATLERGQRVAADPAAVRRAAALGGAPSGTIEVPTITLHTAADPLVAVQNQSLLRDAVGPTASLVQIYTVAPARYPAQPGAPFGAGHCEFTPDSRVGMVALLDAWVRDGQAPTEAAVRDALGPESGYAPDFEPGPWPG